MMLGSRYSQHSFAEVPNVHMARSNFDRSFAVKTTFDFDDLVPIYCDEVLPGDTINLNLKSFLRLAPQVVPLMDNMYVDYFFFFVPNRLTWSNWEKFMGAQNNPGDSTDYLIPQISLATGPVAPTEGNIYDQFGLPQNNFGSTYVFSALPFRAYNLIWNQWFRDENLQNSVTVNTGDGPDAKTDYTLLKRNKRHDYFTSALPWPQKGTAVSLPLGTTAPVITNNLSPKITIPSVVTDGVLSVHNDSGLNDLYVPGTAVGGGTAVKFGSESGLVADLSTATSATINALRLAIMTQSLLELDARGGTRYTEILKAHFNVISPDFRLQRPELLSIGSTRIVQHPVAQTSETTANSPQANLAAFATSTSVGSNVGFSKSFVEHGYVIGLACARADITYQQGMYRMWSRRTRYDFFWPKLQELGEQAIYKKEIYVKGTSADNDVFGYQERYAEYRYRPSEIRGAFRSQYGSDLDVWHLAEEFSDTPSLNSTFIQQSTPIERSLVLTANQPHLLADFWFDQKHARPMMTYGVPASLGRF